MKEKTEQDFGTTLFKPRDVLVDEAVQNVVLSPKEATSSVQSE